MPLLNRRPPPCPRLTLKVIGGIPQKGTSLSVRDFSLAVEFAAARSLSFSFQVSDDLECSSSFKLAPANSASDALLGYK